MRWNLTRRKRRDEDLDAEIAHDLTLDAEERVHDGVAREEAARASRRDFGNVLSAKETTRMVWGWAWLEVLAQDLRYAIRVMRKSPGFTFVAVLSLALGIGVNSAMFSLADALLFRPLSVSRPSEVVTVSSKTPGNSSGPISYRDYVDFRDRSKTFAGLVAFRNDTLGFGAESRDLPQMRMGMLVSGNFFQAMGVEPALGRAFRPDEDQVPGPRCGGSAGPRFLGEAARRGPLDCWPEGAPGWHRVYGNRRRARALHRDGSIHQARPVCAPGDVAAAFRQS